VKNFRKSFAMEESESPIILKFDGPLSPSLGPGWEQRYSGGPGGSLGRDGMGSAVWHASGGSVWRQCIALYTTTALGADNGKIQAVLASSPLPVGGMMVTYLCFRMHTTESTYVRLGIGYDWVRLQAVVNDSVTDIGPVAQIFPRAGESFELSFGDTGGTNHRHFVVRHQGTSIIDFVDTSGVSKYGESYRHVGIGMEIGTSSLSQRPAGLAIVTAIEIK
jgi:hypothetical protein